jgi:CubicO group peptidase (beta-lactamase class C family)
MTEVLNRHNVPGVSVAVVHNGHIDWAAGYGVRESGTTHAVDTTTLFQAASISKPVSAVVALRLVADNELDLDEDVNHRLQSWKVPESDLIRERPVTLRGLLSHSAGLTMHGVPEFAANAEVATLAEILDGELSGASEGVRLFAKPGTTFRYSGGGYIVLQVLLADVTGRPFAELAREMVLTPAGMSSSTFVQPLPEDLRNNAAVGHLGDGAPLQGLWHTLPEQAAGGLWTTPTDLASFMLAVWRSYHGQSDALLPQPIARTMLTRQVGDFGLGFSLPSEGVFRFQHGGGNAGYRCHMVLSVEHPNGAVIMTNGDAGEAVIWEVFGAIARAYGWSA